MEERGVMEERPTLVLSLGYNRQVGGRDEGESPGRPLVSLDPGSQNRCITYVRVETIDKI